MSPAPKTEISAALLDYAVRFGARQDEVLARVARETGRRSDAIMAIPPEQGALMTMLARLTGARRALEVGTFTGYGAICVARGLAPGGTLLCLEISAELAAIARANLDAAGVGDSVDIRVGPALDALAALPPEPAFDFAFIDANKADNPEYYERVLERLEPGGLILLDNTFYGGRVLAPDGGTAQVVHDLNAAIAADDRVDVALVPVADGLTLARKR